MHIKDQIYPQKNTVANNIASRDTSGLNSNPVKEEKKTLLNFIVMLQNAAKHTELNALVS